MSRARVVFLALCVALGVGLVQAGDARADDVGFLAAARDAGFTQDDESLLRDGYMACAVHMRLGHDMTVRVIRRVWMAAGVQFDESKPGLFLSLAKVNLC